MAASEPNNNELGPTRELRSYPPDLTVVLGTDPNKESFQCHGVILAGHSEYVDNMLAAPMKESSHRVITFPDISPENWKKMMNILEPNILEPHRKFPRTSRIHRDEDLLEVSPLFDKYQFTRGLQLCDDYLSHLLDLNNFISSSHHQEENVLEFIVPCILIAHELHLKKSEPIATQCATYILTEMTQESRYNILPRYVSALIPFVVLKNKVICYMVKTILGRREDLSADSMAEIALEESFAEEYLSKLQPINNQRELLDWHLKIGELKVTLTHEREINDNVLMNRHIKSISFLKFKAAGAPLPGVMRYTYFNNKDRDRLVFRAMDPFGKKWQLRVEETSYEHISALGRNKWTQKEEIDEVSQAEERKAQETLDQDRCRVLLFWEGDYGSIVPPKSGWKFSQSLSTGTYAPRDDMPPLTSTEFVMEYDY